MIFNFLVKKKPRDRLLRIPWLEDCYNTKLGYYNLPDLVLWFQSIKHVQWNTPLALERSIVSKLNYAGELVTTFNYFINRFNPYGNLDSNLNLTIIPDVRLSTKSLYEYFTYHDEKEFHPMQVAIGMATLLKLLNDKLNASPKEHRPLYTVLAKPLIEEVLSVARVLEGIYEY